MQSMREWLFKTVAYELTLKGLHSLNLKQMANTGGLNPDELHKLFPDKRSLMVALVKEISLAQKDYIFQRFHDGYTTKERLIEFIVSSFDFIDRNPSLADVIVLALLGSDQEVKEQAYVFYGKLFGLMLDDLMAEEIVPNKSYPLVSDLTEVLLSVMFLGGCPGLQMDYLSFIDPRKVAISTLDAIKKRYEIKKV